jgi:hypothetical protein
MPRTPRKTGTYYDRTRAERLEYQRAYYEEKRETLRRHRELIRHLEPGAHARYLEYQRAYYLRKKTARNAQPEP